MINEMDLLHMDERQRAAWLLANRATVIAVGLAWIGMIVWELAHERSPLFLVLMVPVFALFRGLCYLYYLRLTPLGLFADSVSRSIRPVAALLLIISAFIPMFHLKSGGTAAWELVAEDWLAFFPLAFIYLWPIAVLFAARAKAWKRLTLAVQFVEPFLAAASTLLILWIPQMMWEFDASFVPWLWIPSSARPAAGVFLAVAANGLYVIGWLVLLLRTTAPRE